MATRNTTDRIQHDGPHQAGDSDLWEAVAVQQQHIETQQRQIDQLQRLVNGRGKLRRAPRLLLLAGLSAVAVLALTTSTFAGMPATIPGFNQVIHGCYSTNTGNLRVTGGPCRKGEKPLNWNQAAKFCPRCSFQLTDLSKQDFSGAYFPLTQFSSVNLSGANFNGAYLPDLTIGTVAGPPVNGTPQPARATQLDNATFDFAVMPRASLGGAQGTSARFFGASMHGADISAILLKAQFDEADLTSARATYADLRGARFEQAHIQDMRLEVANLSDADFRNARGTPVVFASTVFGNTVCPDGTNSDNNPGKTCAGHWLP